MSKFNYVWNADGDWEGLYDDGKLVLEDHSISAGDLAAYLGIDWHAAEVSNENTEVGCLPEHIDDLVGVNLGQNEAWEYKPCEVSKEGGREDEDWFFHPND